MPSCTEVCEQMSKARDGRPRFRIRLLIRFHVTMCNLCRRYEQQLKLLNIGSEQYAEPDCNDSAPSISASARDRIRAKLAAARKSNRPPQ